MKIVHLANNKTRCCIGITQGLLKLNEEIYLSHDYRIYGQTLQFADSNIIEKMKSCDLIFSHDAAGWPYKDIFQEYDLWPKVINYDYSDSFKIHPITEYAANNFKRSVTMMPYRIPINVHNVEPINYCALDEYYLPEAPKVYDVGYFFNPEPIERLEIRRGNVLKCLNAHNLPNSLIGCSTGIGYEAMLKISDPIQNNYFHQYLSLMKQCKIVFTANPTRWEGDSRTWEAMASGALVFIDKTYHKLKPLQDGEHCFIYDASEPSDIHRAIDLAKKMLEDEETRVRIAKNGFDFVRRHHLPINRVKMMLWKSGYHI